MGEDLCVCPKCGKKYKLKEGFDAKSFSCKSCGATVWVGGKAPAPAPTPRRSSGAPTARKAGRAASVSAAGGRAGRRGHRHEKPEQEEEGGRRGRGREKPKSNRNILIAVGAVAAIGIVVIIAVMAGKKETPAPQGESPVAGQPGATGTPGDLSASGAAAKPAEAAPGQPAGAKPADAAPTKPPAEGQAQPPEAGEPPPSPEGGEPPTKLGGGDKKKTDGPSPNDPPATLGHLDTTPPELRKQIDELVAVLLDPQAGREVHEAKAKLAAIGKPAFLPILGKMAAIRDTITDTDTMEERLIESSLMLADQCLREMDGYLDAHDKAIIRPGTDKKYVKYILVLHYRRWKDGLGSTPLKDLPEMPGPFDPTKAPKQPGDEEEEGK